MCWTGSSLWFGYGSRAQGPAAVNEFRLLAALPVLLLLCAIATGQPWPQGLGSERLVRLVVSGIVGLAIGDLGYFYALTWIGPRLSSVVQSSWPAIAALMAYCWCGEAMGRLAALGLFLTTLGVVLALLRAREGSAWRADLTARQRLLGIGGALVAAVGQAGGMILSRGAMQPGPDLPEGLGSLPASVVRLGAGTAFVFALLLVRRRPMSFPRLFGDRKALRHVLLGTVFGPVVGILLSMVAARNSAQAGVGAALMSLTPLFMLPVAALAYGARVGLFGTLGTLSAALGAVLMLWD